MKSDELLLVAALLLFVWSRTRPIPSVATSSVWWDPVSQTWKEF